MTSKGVTGSVHQRPLPNTQIAWKNTTFSLPKVVLVHFPFYFFSLSPFLSPSSFSSPSPLSPLLLPLNHDTHFLFFFALPHPFPPLLPLPLYHGPHFTVSIPSKWKKSENQFETRPRRQDTNTTLLSRWRRGAWEQKLAHDQLHRRRNKRNTWALK